MFVSTSQTKFFQFVCSFIYSFIYIFIQMFLKNLLCTKHWFWDMLMGYLKKKWFSYQISFGKATHYIFLLRAIVSIFMYKVGPFHFIRVRKSFISFIFFHNNWNICFFQAPFPKQKQNNNTWDLRVLKNKVWQSSV